MSRWPPPLPTRASRDAGPAGGVAVPLRGLHVPIDALAPTFLLPFLPSFFFLVRAALGSSVAQQFTCCAYPQACCLELSRLSPLAPLAKAKLLTFPTSESLLTFCHFSHPSYLSDRPAEHPAAASSENCPRNPTSHSSFFPFPSLTSTFAPPSRSTHNTRFPTASCNHADGLVRRSARAEVPR